MVEGNTSSDGGDQGLDHRRVVIPPSQSVGNPIPMLRQAGIERVTAFDQSPASVPGEFARLLLGGGSRRDEDEELTPVSHRVFEDGLQGMSRLAFYRTRLRQLLVTPAVDPVDAHIQAGERAVAERDRAPVGDDQLGIQPFGHLLGVADSG